MDANEFVPDSERVDALTDGWERTAGGVPQWFLLRGNRMAVTAVLLVAILVALLLLSVVRPADLRTLLADTNTVQTLFSVLLSGSILLVSIVVSVNSIVLAEEIADIEEQRERIDAAVQYRARIEDFIESGVSPARPAEFLQTILNVIDAQAAAISAIAHEDGTDEFREEADAFADRITDATDHTRSTLADARFGTFEVLLAGLNYDYAWQLHVARRFKRNYGHTLGDDEQEAIDNIVETLKVFATGREYFKSLYYKREFARLSSRLLYVSLPVIVYTSYVLLALDANTFPEMWLLWRPLNITPLVLFTSFSYGIALTPYLVLTAYVTRAMAVTLRTLSAGPFILQGGGDMDEFAWDETVGDTAVNAPTGDDQPGDE